MPATKDGKLWRCQFYYKDWQGKRHKKNKRGFRTRAEAEEWERDFRQQHEFDPQILFENFVELYLDDMGNRLRESTMDGKRYMIETKMIPYFKGKCICDITAADIRAWQNEMLRQNYSPTYLKTINNQMSAMFNYAVRYYDLKDNPCKKAGSIGKSKADEMSFWTKEEFEQFLTAVEHKPDAYMAFKLLFWTGMRVGEMLALQFDDIDTENRIITISKTLVRLKGKDIINPPKTEKGKRKVTIPQFLADDLEEYMSKMYGLMKEERIFRFTRSFLEHEIKRGSEKAGVKRIRIHDLRHSHASMLVELGFQPLEIKDRLGHEKIVTTLDTYSHLYPNKQRQLADRLEVFSKEDDGPPPVHNNVVDFAKYKKIVNQ